jgi:hypothetical protein
VVLTYFYHSVLRDIPLVKVGLFIHLFINFSMKKNYIFFVLFVLLVGVNPLKAQLVANFDDLLLDVESYWNGSDGSGQFVSGPLTFENSYNADYSSWSGFAYSNVTDNTTPGYINQYSSYAGIGALQSENYAVSYVFGSSKLKLTNNASMHGMYVSNASYAALAIKDGDTYSKKFGGETGNDSDWFKLIVTGWTNADENKGTVEFYLADYRFDDNSQDYIVNDWQWVDLSELNNVDYLTFELASTDNGDWGMNTPAYFCVDNVTIFKQIKFVVSNGDEKLDGANIEFAGTNLSTDINGEAIFDQVSPTEQMSYTVTKDGFELLTDVINGFTTSEVQITMTVGVNDKNDTQNQLVLFPNPVKNSLSIYSNEMIAQISVLNLAGQQVMQFGGEFGNQQMLDVSDLKSGAYLVFIKTSTGNLVKKFIKE